MVLSMFSRLVLANSIFSLRDINLALGILPPRRHVVWHDSVGFESSGSGLKSECADIFPGMDAICGLSLSLVWFSPLLREVFLLVLRFSPLLSQKPTVPNSNSIKKQAHGHVYTSSY